MNKRVVILLVICLSCVLTACGYHDLMEQYKQAISGAAIDNEEKVQNSNNKPEEPVTGSSVMGETVSGTGVHSMDNVTFEMQTAQYWVDFMNVPDRVILKAEEIGSWNKKIKQQMTNDAEAEFYDLDGYGEDITGEQLKTLLGKQSFSIHSYYSGGAEVTPEQWKKYYENCNYDAIADFNKIRYGVVCVRADVRTLPTTDCISEDLENPFQDILQSTALAVNEPVLVLYTSKDGNWYYVLSEEYAGWVQKNTIGLCRTREEWQDTVKMEHFLVVTGDRVQTDFVPGVPMTGKYEFTMGTKLCLAENKEWEGQTGKDAARDSYVVKVPVRQKEGELSYSLLAIPLSADIHIGYMEYTKANVVKQAFKMLGNPYGWGGRAGARDCSSFVRDVYLCFGLRLPRNSGDMAKIQSNDQGNLAGLSDKEKIEKLAGTEPGTILQMPGHVMLYLGCKEKNYFVISARGGSIHRVTVNDLHAGTDDGKTWLEQLTTMIRIR